MSQQCKQQWTEHAALGSVSVQYGGAGGGSDDHNGLPVKKSRIQVFFFLGGQTQEAQLFYQLLWD